MLLRVVPIVLIAAAILPAATAAPEGSTAKSLVVYADVRIGGYDVKRDGTLDGAIDTFGDPTRLQRWGSGRPPALNLCVARWAELGLRITFYNLGGRDACEPQWGYFSEAVITGKQWRTVKGLRIGDPTRKMHALYRPTRSTGWWAWLITRWTRTDCAGVCFYPGLEAKALRGRVTAFRVNYAAGGV